MILRERLLELLFPPRCEICHDVTPRTTALCPSCMERLTVKLAGRPCCPVCGKPQSSCVCRGEPFAFSRCISAFVYGPQVADAVDLLKQKPDSPIAGQFGEMMADALCAACDEIRFDWVTEVPMPTEEIGRRGHNQARTLARYIGERLKISYCETPLMRHQNTTPQHTLSAGQRARNARSSYTLAQNGTISGRVLLIDDVMTTGATLDACAALLRGCGAREVVCLTAATTPLRGD